MILNALQKNRAIVYRSAETYAVRAMSNSLEEEKVSDRTQYQRLFAEDMAIPNNKCQKDIARAIGKQETDFVHPPTRLKVIFCLNTKIIPKRVNVYTEL